MKLHVGQGTTVGAVTVFPVWSDRAVRRRGYLTDTGGLVVDELPSASVPQLAVRNDGASPVLVLDGQLFEAGWQHRMATRSSLLAPGVVSRLDVACVEQNRWSGHQQQVTRGRRATHTVRHGHDHGGQHEVWRRVARHHGGSATSSLVHRLDDVEHSAALLRRTVRQLDGQVGVVIGVAGQPLALEVFDHHQTLREQLPHLLSAAALEAHGRPALPTPGRRARRLVERLEQVRLRSADDPSLLRGRSDQLDVMRLGRRATPAIHLRAVNQRHPILLETA